MATTINRAKPFRYNALTTEPTSLAKDNRTILLVMLIEDEAQMRTLEELREQLFTRLDWLGPQILPVKFKQIERGKHGALASLVAAD